MNTIQLQSLAGDITLFCTVVLVLNMKYFYSVSFAHLSPISISLSPPGKSKYFVYGWLTLKKARLPFNPILAIYRFNKPCEAVGLPALNSLVKVSKDNFAKQIPGRQLLFNTIPTPQACSRYIPFRRKITRKNHCDIDKSHLGPHRFAYKMQNLRPVQQLIGHAQQMLYHWVQNLKIITFIQVS